MEEVKVKIGIDDQGFATGLKRDIGQMEQLSATAKKSGMSIDDMGRHVKQLGRDIEEATDKGVAGFGRLEKAAIAFFSIQKAKEFVGKVYEVRSEIEKLETSFRVLVGNKDKADALFASIRKFAVETPMQLKDLAGAAQTMMGFGIATEDVMENLKALGNVAMGDSQKFQSLALAFSQMSATGKLMGQDFLQMVNAGFNPLDQMAKTTGKSVAVLKKEMSEGAISADMVRQAFIDATGEGGKFNGMLEAQSKTMAGAYSNLQGAIGDMLNKIGQKSEGIMSGAIDVATTLAQNYETVGKVLTGLIGTYGVYKAAVMTVTAIESFRTKNLALQAVGISGVSAAEAIHYGWLVLVQKAQALLNATMLTNPYVAVAAAIAAVTAALLAFGSEQDRINAAYDEYIRKKDDGIKKEEEHKRKINELIQIAGDEQLSTDSRRKAMVRLMGEYPELFKKYNTEIEALKDIYKWKAAIAELEGKKSLTNPENELTDIEIRIAELEKKGKWSLASTNSYAGTHTSSRSRTEEEELQALYKRRNEITKIIEKDRGESYLANLTGVSNADLERQINERRNLLAQMATDGKRYGRVKTGGATGVFDQSQLEGQLKKLEWEQNRRKQLLADQSKDFVHEATKAYNAEKVILQQLESLHDPKKRSASNLEIDGKKVSDMGSGEFLAAIEKQQKAVDEAKKKVDAYNKARNGGSSSTSKENAVAKEDASRRQRIFEQELSERQRQAQQLEAMKDAQANAAIANEQNRAKRELMQTEKDHSDALAAIDRQAEEMRKANYEAQKKAWEAANTDNTKSWADTDIAKSVAEHGYKVIALTEAQNETLKALREKENADYARYFDERLKIEDGSRQAVIDAMEEGTAKEIAQLNLDKELKLKAVKEQYEDLKEAKEASARAVAEANDELFDPSSVDFSDIDEWYKKQLKAIAASYSKSMGEIKENNQSSLDQLVLQYGQYADKKAVIERQGEEKIKKLRKQYAAATTDEERQRISEMIMLTEEGTEKQLEQLDEEYDKTKEKVDKLTTALGETIQTVTELGSAMKDLFDIDEADYAKLTKGMKSVQSLAEGIGKIKTGDYLSGGLGILSGLMNAMSLLSGDDDSYRQQVLERIDRHLEVSNKNIEKLTGTLEKSYGNTAWKLGEKAATELTKSVSEVLRALSQMDDLPRHLKDTLGTIGGGGRGYDSTGLPGHGSGWNTGNKRSGEGALDYDWIKDNKKAITEAIDALNDPVYTLSDDAKKYLEELEKLLEQIDELEKSINEQLTGTTAENVYDDFLNSLYDLADGSEDVMDDIADNWQKMVNRMVVNNIVGESFRKQLTETKGDQKSWYDRMAELQHQYSEGIIDNTAYREAMKALMDEYNGYVADAQGQIQTLTEEGVIKPIGEAKKYFSNLRDMWLSTLTDMEADAESWQKEITRIMVEDLINSLVLGDDFEAWLADWKERYADELAHGGDADRLKALVDEMVAKRKELAEQSQGIMDDLGYSDMIKEIEESEDVFEDLHSYFLDALMDMDTDAEEWGKKIGETLARQIIEQELLNQAFDGMLDEWKQGVADYMNLFGMGSREDEEALNGLKAKIAEIVEKYKELAPMAQEFLEALGLIEEAKPETPFNNLRQSFLSTLLDMKSDAESFRRDLDKTLIQDMIEKFIFDVKMTVNGQDFDNFDGYLEDWNRRYLEIFQNVELTQEQKESQLQALIDELMVERDLLDQASADLRERLKEPDDTFKTMSDGWVSTLLDMDATAEDWAKEIGRTMARKIIEQMMVTSMIQPLLDNLQDAFNTAMSRDGATWESVLPELTPYIEEIKTAFGGMQPMVEQILNSFGIFKDDTITSMRENWLSALMDMKAGTADFVNDIKRLLTQKLVEKLVLNSQFDTWLEGIQSQYDAILNSDMSEEQAAAAMNKLAAEWEAKAKEMQEQTQAIFDLTGWSAIVEQMNSPLADLRSSFRSALMDMENDTEDFTNEISKLLTEAFIDRFVLGDEFDKRLSEWQEQYAAIMKGNYSEEERASLLKQLQEAIVTAKEGYAAEAQAIHDLMGTANYADQTATMNMSDKTTYEQMDQYLGVQMGIYMVTEQILTTLRGGTTIDIPAVTLSSFSMATETTAKQILSAIQTMKAATNPDSSTIQEMRNMMATGNEYLLDIKRSNREILTQFGAKLDSINGKLAKL